MVAMIHCHLATLLGESLPGDRALHLWVGFFHGLVAPCFIFTAGYGLGLGMWRRIAKPAGEGVSGRKAAKWLAIFVFGYAMHFNPWGTAAEWDKTSQMNVLSLIALGAILLMLTERLATQPGGTLAAAVRVSGKPPGSSAWRVWSIWTAITALALLFAGLTPIARSWTVGVLLVDSVYNPTLNPFFPVFPWLGFLLGGAALAKFPESIWKHLWLPALALAATAPWIPWSNDSLAFFFSRLGWVLGGIALLRAFAPKLHALPGISRILGWLGRNSLALYVVHLSVLYLGLGKLESLRGITSWWTFEALYLGVLAASVGITFAITRATRWVRHRLTRKQHSPKAAGG